MEAVAARQRNVGASRSRLQHKRVFVSERLRGRGGGGGAVGGAQRT